MTHLTPRSSLIRLAFPVVGGVLLGGFLGLATAQERPPGQLDAACVSKCAANGYETEFCSQVCWIPDSDLASKSEAIDWQCLTACRDRGGKAQECHIGCRRR